MDLATNKIPIYLETGTKKVFACSVDWPGWCRAGKTEEAATEALLLVAPRYAEVAALAHEKFPKIEVELLEVVERIEGSGTTDFGAPGKVAQADRVAFDRVEANRLRRLLKASWDFFDDVVAHAPPTLKKGPRGGGRDRDEVYRHVLGAATAYARSTGIKFKEPGVGDDKAAAELRRRILDSIQPADAPPEKGWPTPYAVRRHAWHILDHAWEIQDKSQS